jgi:hypothetical protein
MTMRYNVSCKAPAQIFQCIWRAPYPVEFLLGKGEGVLESKMQALPLGSASGGNLFQEHPCSSGVTLHLNRDDEEPMKAGGLSSHAVPQIGSSHPHPCAHSILYISSTLCCRNVTSMKVSKNIFSCCFLLCLKSLAPDSGMPSNDSVASLLGVEFDRSVNFAVEKKENNCKVRLTS